VCWFLSAFASTLFLSTFCNKIDAKGRVSVPASFRAALSAQSFQGFVAFCSLSVPAIEGFGMDRMQRLSQQIDQNFNLFSPQQDDWTSLFAQALPMQFDQDGRVFLTNELRAHGQLTKEVLFVGRGPTFQMWNPEAFAEYQAAATARLKAQRGGISLAGSGSGHALDN
jgi:MraZ protein